MPPRPRVIVFDVNETLSDMAPLAQRFAELGLPGSLASVWFASVLRDGFALAATGGSAEFSRIAEDTLHAMLAMAGHDGAASGATGRIMAAFGRLNVHHDVPGGVRALRQHGLSLVTLSNGSAAVADGLLSRAGLRDEFEQLLSVDDAGVWKPATAAYRYAARACQASIDELMLVAVHPWDIHGAHQAGMRTGWLSRQPARYPGYFAAPDVRAPDLVSLARQLAS